MLYARLNNGKWVIGVDAVNIKRLTAGEPIFINLLAHGGTDQALMVYGDTLADIVASIEKTTGQKMPPASAPLTDTNEH